MISPFEKFVREAAEAHPRQTLAKTVRLWDAEKPRYEDDPLRWALSIPAITDALKDGWLVRAVKAMRDHHEGPYGLKECKDLCEQARTALGIPKPSSW
jgi:hypothetical protein